MSETTYRDALRIEMELLKRTLAREEARLQRLLLLRKALR